MTRLITAFLLLAYALTGETSKPNIIYILTDDLGYGDLSCYGQKHFKTPHIDKLAAGGKLFTQHYSGSTVCAPSRSSLMTGQHTGNTYIRNNAEVRPEGQIPLKAEIYTLAEMFKDAGYRTGLFGKWGLGYPGSEGDPLKQGFDRFYGFKCQRQAHHYYPYFLWDDDQRVMLWNNFGTQMGDYAPDFIQKEALRFVGENRDTPFFMYYAHIIPHAEMYAPEKYMKKYRGKFLPESSYSGTPEGPYYRNGGYGRQDEAHAAFAAMMNVLDDHVGELLAQLEKHGLADNTLIIFSSDNGPHMAGGHDPDFFNSNGPLKGHKRALYEGGIRVPNIAYWPGTIQAGTTTDHISAFWDIFPTFAELAGGPVPLNTDGISMVPTLLGTGKQEHHDYLYWEYERRAAVRMGNWKAVFKKVTLDDIGETELYDLSTDVGEKVNLAEQHPDTVQRMTEILRNARTKAEIPRFRWPGKKK